MRRSLADSLGVTRGKIAPILSIVLLSGLFLHGQPAVEAQDKTLGDQWTGQGNDGQWNNPKNWSQGVPNNGQPKNTNYSVSIGSVMNKPSRVTISDVSPTISMLTLSKGNSLSISNGQTLAIVRGAAVTFDNKGELDSIGGGKLTQSGTCRNSGTIAALGIGSPEAGRSVVSLSGTSTNTGTLEAFAGGQLKLSGTWNNTGGTILADSTGFIDNAPVSSEVNIDGTIKGGTLTTRKGGQINVSGSELKGVTIGTGSVVNILPGSNPSTLDGTIKNQGNLSVEGKVYNLGNVTVSGNDATFGGYRANVINLTGAKLSFEGGSGGTFATLDNKGKAELSFSGGSSGTFLGNVPNTGTVTVSGKKTFLDGQDANWKNEGLLSFAGGSTGTIYTLNNQKGATISIDGTGTKLTTSVLVDNGAIKETNGGKLDPPTLSGSGTLELYTSSSAALGSYTMNTGGALIVDKTSLLQISGDWSNQLKYPTQFQVDGKVELNGGGAVQHIEVAGHDYGNTLSANAVAFSNNFNIGSSGAPTGTLQIDSGAQVMLVDQFDNGDRGGFGGQTSPVTWTGNSTGAEALYVWNLVIQPDATIDFDGLHLYYERGASGGVGPDPSVWYADLAIWKAQGDVFIGGEPILIPMVAAASVAEPSSFVILGTALAGLSAFAWLRRRRTVVHPHR